MEVATAAGEQLKRTHLELGGKAPVVVFDDADLELAAAEGSPAPATSTPVRTAPPRPGCWPRRGVHDDFVAALAEQARGTTTGPPADDDATTGR